MKAVDIVVGAKVLLSAGVSERARGWHTPTPATVLRPVTAADPAQYVYYPRFSSYPSLGLAKDGWLVMLDQELEHNDSMLYEGVLTETERRKDLRGWANGASKIVRYLSKEDARSTQLASTVAEWNARKKAEQLADENRRKERHAIYERATELADELNRALGFLPHVVATGHEAYGTPEVHLRLSADSTRALIDHLAIHSKSSSPRS